MTKSITNTITVTNMNGKATRMLEQVQATYNGDNTFTVNLWNFETNSCEHFTVVADERHTQMTFPTRIAELLTPELKAWMNS